MTTDTRFCRKVGRKILHAIRYVTVVSAVSDVQQSTLFACQGDIVHSNRYSSLHPCHKTEGILICEYNKENTGLLDVSYQLAYRISPSIVYRQIGNVRYKAAEQHLQILF